MADIEMKKVTRSDGRCGVKRARAKGFLAGAALPALAAAAILAAPSAVFAQGAPASQQQEAFAIAPQPLPSALDALSEQTGLSFVYTTSDVAGVASPGVSGTMTRREALGRLLAGTGLTARFSSANAVSIEKPAAGAAEDGAIRTAPVRVEGETDGFAAAVDGYVATRSSVATKTNTPLVETPQSVSVVSRELLTIRNAQTDSQALLYVPGVWAQPFGGDQNQNNPFFYIRGFSSAFGGSFVDGLVSPVNYRYEPFGIERVDVFRGPTSTLYGQSDPGGSVHRTTKRPTRDFQGELQFQAGTFDRKQVAGDVSGPIGEDGAVLYRLTGLFRDADAPFDYDFDVREPDERIYIAPALTFQPSDRTSFTILANYLEDEIDAASTITNSAGDLTRINLEQPGVGVYNYEHYSVGYAFEHAFSDEVQVRQNLRWSSLDLDTLGLFQIGIDDVARTVDRESFGFLEERSDLVIDTQVQAAFSSGAISHTVLFGVDYQNLDDEYAFVFGAAPSLNFDNPDYDQVIPPADPFIMENGYTNNVGVYLQEQAKIDERWIVTLGARHDWVRTTLEDELAGSENKSRSEKFTYRAGLSYVSDAGLAPYVSYATSFFPVTGSDINGDPFEPTTGKQIEAGLKYEPNAFNGFFTASLYQLTRENVLTADPQNPFFRVQTGEVRSRGIELEGTIDLDSGLSATASYTYSDVEVTEDNPDFAGVSDVGKRPALTPEHLASAWADYTVQTGGLRGLLLGGGVRHIGSSFADAQNTVENEAYTLFDAVVRYDLAGVSDALAGASIAVNASNVFDKEYTTCFTLFDCQWGAPRTVIATVGYRW
ncbi:MAG: TonB-dependent siderophore receptor [Pseudomonadota bacterium]